ncbi:MAG: hypothetical protein KJZ91_00640 [Myxococcales bacterium]|nr:hypothetical protein [Myxococcales bacterium]
MSPRRLLPCLALAAAAPGLAACPAPACEPAWEVALDAPGGPLLAGWGRAADDGWLVGGGLGQGGARIVRWSGQATDATAALGVARPETLWWVWGSPGGTLWAVGEAGLVLRGPADGSAPLAVVAPPAPTVATLYGVWGRGEDEVWIVGGVADGLAGADDDLVLRWDGAALARVDLPARGAALFKVWGPPDGDELWVSGEAGTLWRRVGDAWHDHALATAASVLTVHGCAADEVYAVGGRHVWTWQGAAWTEVEGLPGFALAAGVACGDDEVLVVGAQGLRLRRDRASGRWHDDALAPFLAADLHGAWAAPGGALLAVGGDWLLPAADRRGVVARRGCR